ncbi:hypothetical protein AQUCO_01700362v1 [Aquilegia coerulea]|uniref:Endonuclease/exonuclease/phosphatase domain-containing protein n=1 Tax=Aquilegia coerulea TaxID=218851 RepID=A0A2G5DMH3_AQUCA|nr:hypothetical protein AQUCO_01700362v1 [Aquilegia coerulea]
MQSLKFNLIPCNISAMLGVFNRKLRRLCSKIRRSMGRPKPKVAIKTFGKSNSKNRPREESNNKGSGVYLNGQLNGSKLERPIRVATFNAAMFSMAPAVPIVEKSVEFDNEEEEYLKINRSMELDIRAKSVNDRPKSILKQSPLHPISITSHEHLSKQQKFHKSKLRVSINLPDNEISLKRSKQLTFVQNEEGSSSNSTSDCENSKIPFRSSSLRLPVKTNIIKEDSGDSFRSNRSILEVLKEVDADILALQDVKAEEEKEMKPLSDLANALGMKYVFAESWAPEYGNAVLSKWPIKRSQVQKIFDDSDFRNVLKATVDVPHVGEINFHCTHLDHLDESWRMKQINAIIQSNDGPHILAGGLNSLDETDYSAERWTDIVKYYEEIGKPTPKVEVVKFLKGKQYTDAKEFAGECESVVMIAKGQNVQGTCKYGTRVDYILASPNSPYKFVPASYSVLSSKA